MFTVTFDADKFISTLDSLAERMNDEGFNAWLRATQDAKESQHQHGYQNRTGKLTASMSGKANRKGPFNWTSQVKTTASYALWVDEKTDAHPIEAKNGKMLRWYVNGQPVFRRRVWHPGTKGAGFSTVAALTFAFQAPDYVQRAFDAVVSRDNG